MVCILLTLTRIGGTLVTIPRIGSISVTGRSPGYILPLSNGEGVTTYPDPKVLPPSNGEGVTRYPDPKFPRTSTEPRSAEKTDVLGLRAPLMPRRVEVVYWPYACRLPLQNVVACRV